MRHVVEGSMDNTITLRTSQSCYLDIWLPRIVFRIPVNNPYGVNYHPIWSYCPGIYHLDDAICSSDRNVERGICSLQQPDKTRNPFFSCNCSQGYLGESCSFECPGIKNGLICSNNGYCVLNNQIAECICNEGYYGESCNIVCPGLNAPCSGVGTCRFNMNDQKVNCFCNSGYYGDSCQYEYEIKTTSGTSTTQLATSTTQLVTSTTQLLTSTTQLLTSTLGETTSSSFDTSGQSSKPSNQESEFMQYLILAGNLFFPFYNL